MSGQRTTITPPERIAQIRSGQTADPTFRERNNEAVRKHRAARAPRNTRAMALTVLRRRYPEEWSALRDKHTGGPLQRTDRDPTVSQRLMTQSEFATAVGVHPDTVREWVRSHRLMPSFRIRNAGLYSDADVERARQLESRPGRRGNVVPWKQAQAQAEREFVDRHRSEFDEIRKAGGRPDQPPRPPTAPPQLDLADADILAVVEHCPWPQRQLPVGFFGVDDLAADIDLALDRLQLRTTVVHYLTDTELRYLVGEDGRARVRLMMAATR